ncbi:aminoglycoside 2'-N-acetyltransferase [Nocardioides psychrotolerans]|uniref:Aminoglycoside 2'-N-acetyltransferase I n=2 Tax=Nocardioides psychrotolerans TaxID=1005945 RepID=A0A1I3CQT2_9ACTN|nr:aminoglycoside 2'-N-acetyltransferase [Nocardioides psychrotolerans]SFH76890.1 aminoglycoside 2'-N-acetyltransferase I [Nocardioides psychrotolerans]
MAHTAELAADELAAVRALMEGAFDDFTDHDWSHALGGMHALVVGGAAGDDVLAQGSLVMRRLLVAGRSLRCGYVEAVATAPTHRRAGHASMVMTALEGLAPAYDLLALSSSEVAEAFYRGRGWQPWRGPSSVMTPHGTEATPDEDGAILVLAPGPDLGLDLDAPITCDWRDGDVW